MNDLKDKRVLVFSNSRLLQNALPNPKNYHYFADVVYALREMGAYTIQCGRSDEMSCGCNERFVDHTFNELWDLAKSCDAFISVDSFFPHMASALANEHKLPGVVVWTITDHDHYGYSDFYNVYEDGHVSSPHILLPMEDIADNLKAECEKAKAENKPLQKGIHTVGSPVPGEVVEALLKCFET